MRTYPRKQKGAALIIGLLLLTIVTLLAITGMNTASTELAMAGNEQYRQNAFEASETGIEQRLSTLRTVPAILGTTVDSGITPIAGSATDQFSTETAYMGLDSLVANSSTNTFVEYHYQIESTGTSSRDANSVHTQGAYVVQIGGGSTP